MFRLNCLAAAFVSLHLATLTSSLGQEPIDAPEEVGEINVDCNECNSGPCCNIRVERGKRRPIIDGVGWVVGIPRKLLFWDRRAENHAVSDATVAEVTEYMQYRRLGNTLVRVNQYAPAQEWRRLVDNREVGAGWRYTLGSLKWLQYTLVPGRLFGKDEYNPYTNTLYLYSDMPTLGLAEAAYANDVNHREKPGRYAAVQSLPIVAMWHETIATNEVIHYVAIHGSSEQTEKIRHDLYARYGIETAGEVGRVLPDGTGLFEVVGALSGHGVAAYDNSLGN